MKDIGFQLYTAFLKKRVIFQEEPFTNTLHKTNLKLIKASLSEPRRKSEVKQKVPSFCWQPNSGRIINDYVFSHESSTLPTSLTRKGSLHHGSKSEILDRIVPADIDNQRPVTTAAVLGGAILIQMLRPGSYVTIKE